MEHNKKKQEQGNHHPFPFHSYSSSSSMVADARIWRLLAVRRNDVNCHSTSAASRFSRVPNFIENAIQKKNYKLKTVLRRSWKRGPISLSSISPPLTVLNVCCRKEMKSSSFAKVITRWLSGFGTGNKYFKIDVTYKFQ